jgi:hypothetical protein
MHFLKGPKKGQKSPLKTPKNRGQKQAQNRKNTVNRGSWEQRRKIPGRRKYRTKVGL